MIWVIAYVVCPILAGTILYFRQGRFLDEVQIPAILVAGPFGLLLALVAPTWLLTSYEKVHKYDRRVDKTSERE